MSMKMKSLNGSIKFVIVCYHATWLSADKIFKYDMSPQVLTSLLMVLICYTNWLTTRCIHNTFTLLYAWTNFYCLVIHNTFINSFITITYLLITMNIMRLFLALWVYFLGCCNSITACCFKYAVIENNK